MSEWAEDSAAGAMLNYLKKSDDVLVTALEVDEDPPPPEVKLDKKKRRRKPVPMAKEASLRADFVHGIRYGEITSIADLNPATSDPRSHGEEKKHKDKGRKERSAYFGDGDSVGVVEVEDSDVEPEEDLNAKPYTQMILEEEEEMRRKGSNGGNASDEMRRKASDEVRESSEPRAEVPAATPPGRAASGLHPVNPASALSFYKPNDAAPKKKKQSPAAAPLTGVNPHNALSFYVQKEVPVAASPKKATEAPAAGVAKGLTTVSPRNALSFYEKSPQQVSKAAEEKEASPRSLVSADRELSMYDEQRPSGEGRHGVQSGLQPVNPASALSFYGNSKAAEDKELPRLDSLNEDDGEGESVEPARGGVQSGLTSVNPDGNSSPKPQSSVPKDDVGNEGSPPVSPRVLPSRALSVYDEAPKPRSSVPVPEPVPEAEPNHAAETEAEQEQQEAEEQREAEERAMEEAAATAPAQPPEMAGQTTSEEDYDDDFDDYGDEDFEDEDD